MKDLNCKTAIVTGSSRGIGRAVALRLAEDGANVIVTYHSNKDTAEKIVSEIKEKGVDAIALLVRDDAGWITGQNIRATKGIV